MDRHRHSRWLGDAHLEDWIRHGRAMAGRGRGAGRHGGPPVGGFGPGFAPFGRGPFGGGGGWFGPGPRHGHRVRRGDVRAAILALLVEQARNGYQIIQEVEERSNGLWRPSAGAVYPALQQLEDEGLIAAGEAAGRREFALTDAGRKYAEEHAEELAQPWAAVADSVDNDTMSLFDLMKQLAVAVVQVSRAGNAAQITEASALLAATRRSLYAILAAEEPAESDETKP